MGSTLGSALQSIGQTGNEVGSADINNQLIQHQFKMDYLANQARQRGLDISQLGQQQAFQLGQGQQDIERQRLAQSRWQMIPGYTRVPHPDDPTKPQYKYTFIDRITNQTVDHYSDEPPAGSPEYVMNSYNWIDKEAKKAN